MFFTPSPVFVDAIINHPGVRPFVERGDHRLLSLDVLIRAGVLAKAFEGGFMLFEPVAPTVYQGHVACLPSSRGKAALAFGRQAIGWLFGTMRASKLLAAAPLELPAVQIYCRSLGMASTGRDLFQEYFEVEAEQWAA